MGRKFRFVAAVDKIEGNPEILSGTAIGDRACAVEGLFRIDKWHPPEGNFLAPPRKLPKKAA
jgi:hypothetical protein